MNELKKIDEMRIIRKVLSKLRKKEKMLLLDLLGGVADKSKRSSLRYAKDYLAIELFNFAKSLEAQGLIEIESFERIK